MVIIHKKHKETVEEKEIRIKTEQEKSAGIQDEYQARGFELVSWMRDHKIAVSMLIVAFLLGGIFISGYMYYRKQGSLAASSAYLTAVTSIEGVANDTAENKEKWQQAEKSLLEMAAIHKHSKVAVLAQIYAGHLALENNNASNAVTAYQGAIKSLDKADPFYALSTIGLAYAEERNGNAQGALAAFEGLLGRKDNLAKDLVLWEAARLAHDMKDQEKAKKYLNQLLEEFPASTYEKNAKKLKETLL